MNSLYREFKEIVNNFNKEIQEIQEILSDEDIELLKSINFKEEKIKNIKKFEYLLNFI